MKNIQTITEKYFQMFPEDKRSLEHLTKQLKKSEDIFNRKNFTGHVVANSLVLNSKNEVLTIFHNKLKMYIQPGGHVDQTDELVVDATRRELAEETGLKDVDLDEWHKETSIPIFIESHLIPQNVQKEEEEHYHHDLMYIFKTNTNDVELQPEEVSDYKWININKILEDDPDSFIGKSLTRMLELNIIKI
jgi:8-oxo-dGTP pyrophosphatase MutT (NUDIX family)